MKSSAHPLPVLPALGLLAVTALQGAPAAQPAPLSLDQALGRGGPRVRYWDTPGPYAWADDGQHLITLRDGELRRIDPATLEESDAEPDDVAALRRMVGRRGGRERSAVRLLGGEVWVGPPDERDRDALRQLTEDGGEKRILQESPDGARASYVRDNDLWVVDVENGERWQVTDDGGPDMFHGVLDWVYQEEVYGRGDFQGHWWSEDGEKVAFLSLDETAVKDFFVIDHVPEGALTVERAVEAEVSRYPKAGDPNPTARVSIAWPGSREVVPVDLSGYPDDVLVVRVGWTPDDEHALLALQDRIQTWLELVQVDPASGAVTRVLREESPTWVNRLPLPRWLEDGTFLWMSERSGYQHVYHYRDDVTLIRPVTSGEWQVLDVERVGELDGSMAVWFTGTKDGAVDRNLYRVGLGGGEPLRLTQGPGVHRVDLNADGTRFVDTVSTLAVPPEVRLCSGDGSECTVLEESKPDGAKEYVWSAPRLVAIEARDGYVLDGSVILPPGEDAARGAPVFLPTYSGPDAPSVRNSFQQSAWDQFLAQQGFVVLRVNVRSASGRGQVHTGACYKQLGVVELRDLEDAVDWVVAEYGADPKRVAIEGWSYGGFMAGYALTHSEKFALGLAGGGVYDWRLYDTIYTERYMSTPERNSEGYDKTSVIRAAKDLKGKLVIMHGVMDDNVHVQNAMQLVHALQNSGVDGFEMMLYPKARHGVGGAPGLHRRKFVWRQLRGLLEG